MCLTHLGLTKVNWTIGGINRMIKQIRRTDVLKIAITLSIGFTTD